MGGQLGVYRCPADNIPSANGQRLRTYSMNSQVGNIYSATTTKTYNPATAPTSKPAISRSARRRQDLYLLRGEHVQHERRLLAGE